MNSQFAIGFRLYAALMANNLSVVKLAEKISTSSDSVKKCITKKAVDAQLKLMAKELGVTYQWIKTGNNAPDIIRENAIAILTKLVKNKKNKYLDGVKFFNGDILTPEGNIIAISLGIAKHYNITLGGDVLETVFEALNQSLREELKDCSEIIKGSPNIIPADRAAVSIASKNAHALRTLKRIPCIREALGLTHDNDVSTLKRFLNISKELDKA